MKYIMVSRYFLKDHPHSGEETGFVEKILDGRKIHTIRANKNGHFKDGNVVELRYWHGAPYRSPQIPFATIQIGIESVELQYNDGYYVHCIGREPPFPVRAYVGPDHKLIPVQIDRLAEHDGLFLGDFIRWFFWRDIRQGKHTSEFSGDIIHFTDFRYNPNPKEETQCP